MKRLIIMLFLVVTSISFSRRYEAVVLNGKKEYSVSMKIDSHESQINYHETGWYITNTSRIFNNGYKIDYIKIEKDGDIKKGIVPIKLVVSSSDSENLLNGPLLQVIQAEMYFRLGIPDRPIAGRQDLPLGLQHFTFIKNIDEVIIKQTTEINLGTLYSGEELSQSLLSRNRLIQIKYNTYGPGGYVPMMDIDVSGSGITKNLKITGGNYDYINKEIILVNQRTNSNDSFKINGTYTVNFKDPGNGYIDLNTYRISGEYPKDYGIYKAVETINITLY
ncbi:hypothetical protein [Psychrilyobacter atlanticus]|uniref:hypothetical protein n=1 Tax=Psychrilyobacter atlanticus TaxID=271091 RepID=UPI0004124FF4|nr:hypothetical protein [Psychrilyobacter atlanticus]